MARIQDLKVNKITKSKYDQLVASGTITKDMITNQLWIFTDDQYVSAQNIKDWNSKADVSDIPTKLSSLSNDSGFITQASIPTKVSQLTNDSNYAKKTDIPSKTSQLTNDSSLAYKSDIPVAVSQLNNDSNYAKVSDIPTKTSQLVNDSNFMTSVNVPTKVSELVNDAGYITDFTEEDPTVPSWAKQANKPTYNKSEVGLGNVENKSSATIRSEITSANVTSALGYTPVNPNIIGQANGLATLGTDGKVPSSQLPSYVDDILEATNKASFPSTGETGKIYVAKDTNLAYRWSGSGYTEISPSLALGETSSTAYPGDKGKTAYTHSQSAHAPTNAQANIIENISVNGTNATITNKTAAISVPTKMSQLTNDMGYSVDGSIPTKLSQLENDKGFITSSNIPTKVSAFTNDAGYITSSSLPTKTSELTNDSGFITQAAIPTKTSQLTNNSGYITSASLPKKVSELENDAGYLSSANIPSKTSQLTNDSGYITSASSITGNAATATTASKTTGTLTIQKNGSNVQTFNGSGNVTANITVPTAVSELTNDSNYIKTTAATRKYSTSMVALGFTMDQRVSPYELFKVLYNNYGTGAYVVVFDWSNANAAYVVNGNDTLYVNGGEMLVSITKDPNTTTWVACNALFIGYSVDYAAILAATVSSTAGSGSSSMYMLGNTRVYSGSSAPTSDTGRNGDIYIQTS